MFQFDRSDLAVPGDISTLFSDVMGQHHPGGWGGVRSSNHELVLEGRSLLAGALGASIPAPDSMIGAIASIALPPASSGSDHIFDPLMEDLRFKWRIEVPVFAWPDASRRLIRVSAQQYNSISDYEKLAEALVAELAL